MSGPRAARAQATTATPAWQWAVSSGRGAVTSVATDTAGSVVVAGWFTDTVTIGTTTLISYGDFDMFVARLNPQGQWQWVVRAGAEFREIPTRVALDPRGNIVVAGTFTSPRLTLGNTVLQNRTTTGLPDIFIGRLSAAGVWQSALSVGGIYEEGVKGLAIDRHGNVYVAGYYSSAQVLFGTHSLTTVGTNPRPFVAKLTPANTWAWAAGVTSMTLSATTWAVDVAVDSTGAVYTAGVFSAQEVAFGTTTLVNSNSPQSDIFVAHLDSLGQWQWAVRAGGRGGDGARGLTLDRHGRLFVAGEIAEPQATFGTTTCLVQGAKDLFVACLTRAGLWQWARSAGGNDPVNYDIAYVVRPDDATGDVYVAGQFAGTATFGAASLTAGGGRDVFVARLSAAGTWRWAVGATGTLNDDAATDLAVAPHQRLVVVGNFANGNITFGATTLSVASNRLVSAGFVASLEMLTGLTDEAADHWLRLWPNPARHAVRLENAPAPCADIVDALGRSVRTFHFAQRTSDLELSLQGLVPGLYLVRCGGATRRLVIE